MFGGEDVRRRRCLAAEMFGGGEVRRRRSAASEKCGAAAEKCSGGEVQLRGSRKILLMPTDKRMYNIPGPGDEVLFYPKRTCFVVVAIHS